MKTDELIHELGRELRPVRRLSPPWRRALAWLAYSAVYVAAVAAFAWIRGGPLGVESNGLYLVQQGALALASALAALAAFASVVPGTASRGRIALSIPMIVIMGALLWGMSQDLQRFGTAGFGRETDWPCVASITIGGVAMWGVASAMLRRGAVLEPRATSVLAGIAAVSLANIEACVSRVHTFSATIVAWHGATVVALMIAAILFGPRVLTRRDRVAS
jgi:hypothetical protein